MNNLSLEALRFKVADAIANVYYEGKFTAEEVLGESEYLDEGFNECSDFLSYGGDYYKDKREAMLTYGFELAEAGKAGGEGEGEEAFQVWRYVPTDQFIGRFGYYASWDGFYWDDSEIVLCKQIPTFTYGEL